MSEYTAQVSWQRQPEEVFTDDNYSRGHEWTFDGGVVVPASASPHIVPPPRGIEANVDPEEAFVASLSSCHMLFFLALAQKRRYVVDSYRDNAVGIMDKNAAGQMAMTQVTLRPQAVFSGEKQPSAEQLEHMHHKAHELCFIANSVKSEITIEIVP